jgi:hypothetical protein
VPAEPDTVPAAPPTPPLAEVPPLPPPSSLLSLEQLAMSATLHKEPITNQVDLRALDFDMLNLDTTR